MIVLLTMVAVVRQRPKRLPLGEAGAKIGTSEPIFVTDEGEPGTKSINCSYFHTSWFTLIRPGLRRATFPQGKALVR